MFVLRVRRSGFVVLVSFLLAACTGSSEPDTQPIDLSGSVGDGPVVGADVEVTDAAGEVLEQLSSDGSASYALTLPEGTELPALVTASGGTDLVTGRALDFALLGAVLEDGEVTVNVTPLSTLAVHAAQCTEGGLSAESLDAAWQRVFEELSMGLDRALVTDPMREPVDAGNVEAVLLANEAVGETVRRTVTALAATGSAIDGDAIIDQLACDLMSRGTTPDGETVDPRVVATFKGAELGVRLETLAGRLEVDGVSAVSAMNEAIRTIMPAFSDPDVTRVPVTADGRDQALALAAVLQPSVASDALVLLAADIDGAAAGGVAGRVDAALTPALQTDLRAATDNLAFADDATLAELSARRAQRDAASPPMLALAAEPSSISGGDSSQLSWAASNADACVADGGWGGDVALEGARSTGALQQSTRFELACTGLGGTVQRAVSVTVDGVPLPEPNPVPLVELAAADSAVAEGGSTELRWSSTDASTCTADGGWSGSRPVSGSTGVGPLAQTTVFRLTCTGDGGSSSDSVTVTVEAQPAPPVPEVSLSAADATIAAGGSTELRWSSTDASACTAEGGWSGSRPVSGSAGVGPLAETTTYRLTCSGDGGSASDSVTVTVEAQPQPAPAPTLSLAAADGTVDSGGSTELTWSSSDADSCSASGGWSGSRAVSGSATVGPIEADTTYTLSCSGPGGSAERSVTVTARDPAPEPSVSLDAADSVVDSGSATQLTWSSTEADSCTASGGWSGSRATSGSESTGALAAETTFTLNCSGPGGSAMAMISVAVNGTVALEWEAPTENVDGSPLTDLGGYRIYYGSTSRSYGSPLEVASASTSSYSLTLPSGTYYFAMTAVDAEGNESAYSNEVVKVVD